MVQLLNKESIAIVTGGSECRELNGQDWGGECTSVGFIGKRIRVVSRGASWYSNIHIYCQGTDRGFYEPGRDMSCQPNEMIRIVGDNTQTQVTYFS